MTTIIGITGGIGSGKSTLSKYLKKLGYPVHESDKAVSEMYTNPKKSFIDFIKKCGLKDAVTKKNINKKIIANEIFNNQTLKKKFEKHIHKEVGKKRKNFIKKNLTNKKKAMFIDVPLLLENRLERECDLVLCVLSTRANRIKRLLKNKNFSKTIIRKIIKNQTTDKNRKSQANIIITNNKTKKDFILKAQRALMDVI